MPVTEPTSLKEAEVYSENELATFWLTRELKSTHDALENNTSSLKFTRNYKPKPIIKPPGIESASADYEDWQKEEYEYQHWPEQQESDLEYLEGESESLSDKLDELMEYQTQLGQKDHFVIHKLAEMEKARLANRDEIHRKEEERKREVHFEGIEEVNKLIKKLKAAEKSGKIKQGQVINEWTYVFTSQEGYAYHLHEGKGPLGGYDASISIGKDWVDDDPQIIHVGFKNILGIQASIKDDKVLVDRNGIAYSFNIKGNIVKNRSIYQARPGFDRYKEFTIHYQEGEDPGTFTQAQFDDFKAAFKTLTAGL
jgi:hypothetical protein